MNNLVSVIIPSYNRYDNLLNTIDSIKKQTYNNYEIIVIDDGSSDKRYKDVIDNVTIINLETSSKYKLGYACGAIPRNKGLEIAKGDYIAFCDDDDIWMPEKLEIQIKEMIKNNISMSCTEGYIGFGFFDSSKKYKLYNSEYYNDVLKKKYGLDKYTDFPEKFDLNFLLKHNFIITSSICFKKELKDKTGFMKHIKNGGEIINGVKDWQDYNYWRRMLTYSNCLYIKTPLFYYDLKKY